MPARRAHHPTIIPEALKKFGRARLIEAVGLMLLATTIFILLAIFSFNPDDPSFNHATDGHVRNLGGSAGANVADLLLQWLGLASLVLVGILCSTQHGRGEDASIRQGRRHLGPRLFPSSRPSRARPVAATRCLR